MRTDLNLFYAVFLIFNFLVCNVCCDEQCQSLKGILFVDFEDHAALSDF